MWSELKITHLFMMTENLSGWSRARDDQVLRMAADAGITAAITQGHNLYNPATIVHHYKGKAPLTYTAFLNVIAKLPPPPEPKPPPTTLPALTDDDLPRGDLSTTSSTLVPTDSVNHRDHIDTTQRRAMFAALAGPRNDYSVPDITEFGFTPPAPSESSPHHGGETRALSTLHKYVADKKRVAKFEKPKTSPAAFQPASTTVLSPHLKFGTLSSRTFYAAVLLVERDSSTHSQPPVSLRGQLLWREFYYCVAYATAGYERMVDNPVCLLVDWWCAAGPVDESNPAATENLKAWSDGRTGFPWIDAIMTQLRKEGWIHHLARHATACFLTRGDLFVSWERGAEVFEELLIDHDPALNVGNWLWLSASAFFHQYFRVYSPVTFGKKYDKNGKYIRKYVPVLKNLPSEYIYEPWKAPAALLKKHGVVLGQNYPHPIVDHDVIHKVNMARMKMAYAAKRHGGAGLAVPDTLKALGVEEGHEAVGRAAREDDDSEDSEDEDEDEGSGVDEGVELKGRKRTRGGMGTKRVKVKK
ncbi:hypothetical protein HK101_010815 [Irineochytrium annulatum]|nr:hypothetical protein HK101_010815 [Irineochytrium annulatum]